jgi:catalase
VCPTAAEAIDAIEDRSGRYPAARASHAKGTLCRGVFRPTAEAAALTQAAHMHRSSVGVTVRFSNASTKPDKHDGASGPRGMATRFHLDDEGTKFTDIVAVTMSSFFVRTPDDFVALTRARGMIRPFMVNPKGALKAQLAALQKTVPSYANCRFNSLHAFRWTDGEKVRLVRYSWLPLEGEQSLGRRQHPKRRERDYLQQDLHERLDTTPARPIKFNLQLQLASVKDKLFDPSKRWPQRPGEIVLAESGERRERFVHAGELEVTGIDYETSTAQLRHFDPAHVTEGIEAPREDSILRFRPAAYEVSFERRTA